MPIDFSKCNPKGKPIEYFRTVQQGLVNEQARDFMFKYLVYTELVDDLVDGGVGDIEKVKLMTQYNIEVFNHPYYVKYRESLLMIEMLANITFFDTVEWERSNSEWKRRDARCLNHFTINMVLAILLIEIGMTETRLVSNVLRERIHSYSLFEKEGCYYPPNSIENSLSKQQGKK